MDIWILPPVAIMEWSMLPLLSFFHGTTAIGAYYLCILPVYSSSLTSHASGISSLVSSLWLWNIKRLFIK